MTANTQPDSFSKYNIYTCTSFAATPEILAIRETVYSLIGSLSEQPSIDCSNELPITPDLSYRVASSPEFLRVYYHLILRLKTIFNKEFSFQKSPTLRLLNKHDNLQINLKTKQTSASRKIQAFQKSYKVY